ncbi:MAG: RNA-binding domain-containing protein [Bacteroidota bacterium]
MMSNQEQLREGALENPLFKAFSSELQDVLLSISTEKAYEPDSYVFYASETGSKDFFIVLEGELLLSLSTGAIKTYKKGDLFGEVSVLSDRPRMGSIRAITQARLLAFDGEKLYDKSLFSPEVSLEVIHGLSGYVIGYLNDEEYRQSTRVLINQGEGANVEFKESLSKTIRSRVIKTICAFFNTRGGVILLGVDDDGNVKGLEVESEKKLDEYKLSVIGIIKRQVGSQFGSYLTFNNEKIDDKLILRINCVATPFPAIFETQQKDQIFYMRSGPSNIVAPNIKEILSYYKERFIKG